MSAELLRRPASLMRERAEAARPSPWVAGRFQDTFYQPSVKADEDYWIAECNSPFSGGDRDARHIASWHPAVALAVADWLDASAGIESWGKHIGVGPVAGTVDAALAVARTYLGEDA